jgi:hypothetical protein
MNRMALAVLPSLVTLLLAGACTSPAKSTGTSTADTATDTATDTAANTAADTAPNKATGAETAKASAPVSVNAQLSEGRALVTVRFESPASNVRVKVYGVDGLVVKSAATPVDGASFVKDGATSFDVAFTPGPGRSHLAVAVTGSFVGGERSSVSTFAIGTPSPEQQKGPGTVMPGDNGQPIKVMPANGQ